MTYTEEIIINLEELRKQEFLEHLIREKEKEKPFISLEIPEPIDIYEEGFKL